MRRTRQQLLDRIKELVQQLYPGDGVADLSCVYDDVRELEPPWNGVMEGVPFAKLGSLRYLPVWYFRCLNADEHSLLTGEMSELVDVSLVSGKDLCACLDELKEQLGKDPKNALVIDHPDKCKVVRQRNTTKAELEQLVQKLEGEVTKEAKAEAQLVERMALREAMTEVKKHVGRLGADRVLQLLRSTK